MFKEYAEYLQVFTDLMALHFSAAVTKISEIKMKETWNFQRKAIFF